MTDLEKDCTGVVAWFSSARGIGFITRDNGDKDLFVHWSNIEMEGYKTLKAGQSVSFTIGENHQGQQGEHIVILSEPEEEVQ